MNKENYNNCDILISRKTLLAVLVGAGITSYTHAGAEVESARKTASQSMMEEVQIFATKKGRSEAAQDVPIAISAYGQEQLEAMFLTKIDALGFTAPNIALEEVGTFPGVQNFTIRGLGINSSIPSTDPTVGAFIDGIFLGMSYGVVTDMFDVESVEVLRGPQGLLFGRNVTGGAVLIRTRRPDGEFHLNGKLGYSSGPEHVAALSVEGSLVEETLAGKVAVYHRRDQGYFDNVNPDPNPNDGLLRSNPATGRNVGRQETVVVRPALVYTPNEDLDITLIYEHGKMRGDGGVWQSPSLGTGTGSPIGDFENASDSMGRAHTRWNQVTFETNYQIPFGNGTITNLFGWREVESENLSDVDGSSLPVFILGSYVDQDQFSNELRYAGTFADNWDLSAGLYYFEQDIEYLEPRIVLGGALNVALGGRQEHKTWGAFINNDFQVTPELTLTAGLRYTKEDKRAGIITDDLDTTDASKRCIDIENFNCTFTPFGGDWSNLTPKLGFQWRLTEDAMLYGFWTKGFRSGGFNFRSSKPELFSPGPTAEEEQNSFEVGIKSQWFDNKLRFNISAFYNEIKNVQRDTIASDAELVILQATQNTADATIKGFEIDVVALLGDGFSINASVGRLDGEYDDVFKDITQDGIIDGSDEDLALPRLSKLTWSVGTTWDMPVGDMGNLTLRTSFSHRDEAAFSDDNKTWLPAVDMVNVSATFTSVDDRWDVSIYGKNLKDEVAYGNVAAVSFGIIRPLQKGTVYGVEANYRF